MQLEKRMLQWELVSRKGWRRQELPVGAEDRPHRNASFCGFGHCSPVKGVKVWLPVRELILLLSELLLVVSLAGDWVVVLVDICFVS